MSEIERRLKMTLEKRIPIVDTLIDVGGTRLFFSVLQGSDTTILLEVGGGADSSYWGDFPRLLAKETGATLIIYDRAGFGKSDLPDTPYDMVEEVDWLMEGLRQLDLDEDLILAGHSYGGWLIRLIASRYPDTVRGMVFIDPFSAEFVNLLGVEYIDCHPMCSFPDSNMDELSKNQRAGLRMLKVGVGPKAKIMQKTTIPRDVPVWIITSGEPWWLTPEEDQAWRKAHEQMAASIPGAVLQIAEGCDHLIPEKQPEIIIKAMKEVIRLAKQ
jgi:pimeloyl-ACP methyl ester carboxylesterase